MDATITRSGRGRLRRDQLHPKEAYSREGFTLKGAGPWVEAGICPFHKDHKPSFRVNLETGRGRCMSCGWSGDLLSFAMQKHGLGFQEAARYLGIWEDAPTAPGPSFRQREREIQSIARGRL